MVMEVHEREVWMLEVTIQKFRDGEITLEECWRRINLFIRE